MFTGYEVTDDGEIMPDGKLGEFAPPYANAVLYLKLASNWKKTAVQANKGNETPFKEI